MRDRGGGCGFVAVPDAEKRGKEVGVEAEVGVEIVRTCARKTGAVVAAVAKLARSVMAAATSWPRGEEAKGEEGRGPTSQREQGERARAFAGCARRWAGSKRKWA